MRVILVSYSRSLLTQKELLATRTSELIIAIIQHPQF